MTDEDDKNNQAFANRLALADFVLAQLAKDRYPTLVKFLKDSRYDVYEILDRGPFESGTAQPDLQELLKASRIAGTIHVSMQETPRCRLFYGKKDLTDGEASLLAYAFQRAIALAYAAIGLDMSGLCIDEDALTALAKQNAPDTK